MRSPFVPTQESAEADSEGGSSKSKSVRKRARDESQEGYTEDLSNTKKDLSNTNLGPLKGFTILSRAL